MPSRPPLLALALLCLGGTAPAAAAPSSVTVEQRYDWPRGAEIGARFRRDHLELIARMDPDGAAAGISTPWLVAGPLVGRGLLRLASDPLGFSAESPVFEEGTGLALDASLESSRRGALLMPVPGALGLFAREGADGDGFGAFADVALGTVGFMDALLLSSGPASRSAPDDWYFDRSPWPGGRIGHGCARLSARAGGLRWTLATGSSFAEWAPPGAFADLRMRGYTPGAEAAFLLAAVTPGYRSPDGKGTAEQSLAGMELRLGGDADRDEIDAAWSLVVERPSAVPGLEIPRHLRLRVALARRSCPAYDLPIRWIAEGDKDVYRAADGRREESSRLGSALSISTGETESRLSLGLSGADGARIAGEVALRPSAALRLGLDAGAQRLGTRSANASLEGMLVFSLRGERHEARAGIVDCPLAAGWRRTARYVRLSLESSFRVP